MKKILFVIPGFGQSSKDKEYLKFKINLQKKYSRVIVLDIKWKRQVMTNYLEQVRKEIYKYHEEGKIDVLGFSYGAMIAFILSIEINFDRVFLCSLSPYFKEHMSNLTKRQARFLKIRRRQDFENYSYINISKQISKLSKKIYSTYIEALPRSFSCAKVG